jgi:hypothetical protein
MMWFFLVCFVIGALLRLAVLLFNGVSLTLTLEGRCLFEELKSGRKKS